jgi:HEPN domain-containing protein
MKRQDLQRLSRTRIREAKSLLSAGHSSGAYYLGGYAVECALKACIAKMTARYDFPDKNRANNSYTHDLTSLLKTANLDKTLDSYAKTNPDFDANWKVVKEWSEQTRYRVNNLADAAALLLAISHPKDGVLPWLKLHW